MLRKIVLLIILCSLLSACTGQTPAPEVKTLKIAVIPVIDTLPLFVAQSEGLFEKNNIKVELIPVASAPERDQLLQAGQADGSLNETLSVMFFNADKIQLQAVRYGLMATKSAGHFFILASGNSGIVDVSGLKGVEIGISQGTIIDYVTTRLLEANGFTAKEIKTLAVPKISDRMSLLASGQIKAATMPDPLAALAIQQGAKIIADDSTTPTIGASIISFRKEVIDANPDAIKAFLKAYEEAVVEINTSPEKFSGILAEKKIVPQPLIASYKIPQFPLKGIPSEAEWNDVLAWGQSRNLVKNPIAYSTSVTSAYLP